MLTDSAFADPFYKDIESLVSGLGLKTVEAVSSISQGARSIRVVVFREDKEVDTEDLAKVYNIIYPRYSVLYSDRDLQLEVSSPGLQRTFKDVMEFSIFTGKVVRAYSISRSAYVTGRIEKADESSVLLADCSIDESNEREDHISIPYSDIAKARLEYRWEA